MIKEEEFKKRLNDLDINQKKIESQLLEQEHRPFTVIKNYLNRNQWKKNDIRRKSVKLAILWRLFFSPATMAIVGGGIGFVTVFMLIWQNKLLVTQNNLITNQNNLIEAERRSAQVFVMSDVLQDLQKEINEKDRKKDSIISNVLAGRIVALTRAMKPYRRLQTDTLSNLISPERGQLLITLIRAGINKKQLNRSILDAYQGDFSYAELAYANLSESDLSEINLSRADLKNANFYESNLRGADLVKVDLTEADLSETNLSSTDLTKACLRGSELGEANLNSTNFTGADLRCTDLVGVFLTGENNVFVAGIGSNTIESRERRERFYTNFTNAILDSALVDRKDWIRYIKEDIGVIGAKEIDSLYRIRYYRTIFKTDSIFQLILKDR